MLMGLHLRLSQPGASLCLLYTGQEVLVSPASILEEKTAVARFCAHWPLTCTHSYHAKEHSAFPLTWPRKGFASSHRSSVLVFIMAVPMSRIHTDSRLHPRRALSTPLTESVGVH